MRKMFVKVIMILHYIIDPVSSYQSPMLQQYHKLPQLLDRLENTKTLKIGAATIAAHGITDLITKPLPQVGMGYLSGFTLTYFSPVDVRYLWLVLGSTYHFSKDMVGPFKLIQSLCLHISACASLSESGRRASSIKPPGRFTPTTSLSTSPLFPWTLLKLSPPPPPRPPQLLLQPPGLSMNDAATHRLCS